MNMSRSVAQELKGSCATEKVFFLCTYLNSICKGILNKIILNKNVFCRHDNNAEDKDADNSTRAITTALDFSSDVKTDSNIKLQFKST